MKKTISNDKQLFTFIKGFLSNSTALLARMQVEEFEFLQSNSKNFKCSISGSLGYNASLFKMDKYALNDGLCTLRHGSEFFLLLSNILEL